jgi:hypothetical protein
MKPWMSYQEMIEAETERQFKQRIQRFEKEVDAAVNNFCFSLEGVNKKSAKKQLLTLLLDRRKKLDDEFKVAEQRKVVLLIKQDLS